MSDVVLAITRGGFGDIYSFASGSPDLHPLIQYGDAVLRGPDDLTRQYNLLELPRLLVLLQDEKLRVEVLASVHPDLGLSDRERLRRVASRAEYVWNRMLVVATPVPVDTATICDLIVRDRTAMTINPKENRMPDDEEVKTPAAAAKPAKAEKPAKEPKPKLFADDAVINFGADAAGKKYDAADNNPKRKGSKAYEQFAQFKEGQTVGEFVKAIGTEGAAFGELKWSADQGFVTISGYTPPPKAPKPVKAAKPAATSAETAA